jgi:hypothetical protein
MAARLAGAQPAAPAAAPARLDPAASHCAALSAAQRAWRTAPAATADERHVWQVLLKEECLLYQQVT